MNSLTKALSKKIGGTAKKINASVSDAMSYPARAYHGAKARRADNEFKVLRRERDERLLPDTDLKGNVSDAAKIRSAADAIRRKRVR